MLPDGSFAVLERAFDFARGVRCRVIVAPELYLLDAWPITGVRKDALESGAIVRRPVGRALKPLQEQAPALTVMLEGGGLRQENPETPTLKVYTLQHHPHYHAMVTNNLDVALRALKPG